jgi:hypothetical protein
MIIIRTSARFNILSCFIYGILTLFPIIATIDIIRKSTDLSSSGFLMVIPIILFIVLFSLRILLWFILGKETVFITDGELIVRKKGTFLIKREKRIPLQNIQSVVSFGNFEERYSPSKLVGRFSRQMYIFRIQNVGRIRIQMTNGRTFCCLDNISLEKAKEIADQIRQEIN